MKGRIPALCASLSNPCGDNAMSNLKIRRIPFQFDGVDFIWNPHNPSFSIMMNKVSFFAIALEKYFCQAIRDADPQIKDPVVREEARLFVAQEGAHSLAHRKHVKALIEQSGTEVAGGSKLVAEAARKLEAMLEGARMNYDLLQGIARESREQANSIEEVNAAVRTMDEMTQHNAALVEQTNAAIEQTEAQASELDKVVAIFTIDERPAGRASTPAPAPVAAPPTGIKGLQEKVKQAAKSYLAHGSAAVRDDWSEF